MMKWLTKTKNKLIELNVILKIENEVKHVKELKVLLPKKPPNKKYNRKFQKFDIIRKKI